MAVRPDDNWLQRRYFGWAEKHYHRMPPRTRAEVERIDRWLYSRRGVGVLAAAFVALAVTTVGLAAAGIPWLIAVSASLGIWLAAPMAVLGAWLQPERFAGPKAVRFGLLLAAGVWLGAAAGFLSGRIARYGSLEPSTLLAAIGSALRDVAVWMAVAIFLLAMLLQLTAFARRRLLRADLERAILVAERDASARQAAEARLRLLQGQIRPHFIFNTLASLQHWVDTGDVRAGPLLRSLTALLRTATDAMDGEMQTLGLECQAARHYLEVMRTRLGGRLSFHIDAAAETVDQLIPVGLVLTLVENAVEHGIEPKLDGGSVEVLARKEGEVVLLEVRDDGSGMEADAVEGIGLANSRARLQHHFGDRATLELTAAPAPLRGTAARLRIRL